MLVVFTAGVVLLMAWLVGAFKPKIEMSARAEPDLRPLGGAAVLEVESRTLPREETATGTIQAVHRVELASRLLARAIEVTVIAGQHVQEGEVLVRLEDTDLRDKLAQAEAAVAESQAALDLARLEASRLRTASEQNAVGAIELDRALSAVRRTEASLNGAEHARDEAKTILEYATIRSPIDGVVVDKRVETGDTVTPGKVVVTLLDPTRMQLVANVRESLSRRLHIGGTVLVKVDVLNHSWKGTVSEIVPQAEGTSRTFQVKVTGPSPEGVYAGMFGRLIIPVGEETVVLIPRGAVRTIGQVDCVDIAQADHRVRRAVRLGRDFGDEVEVLAGLDAGERIVLDPEGTDAP